MLERPRSLLNALKANQTASVLCRAMLGCIVYLAIGAVFYTNVEGWSVVTAVYFSMVTMSTVGYGDFAPSTVGGKAFTLLWRELVKFPGK